MRLWEVVRFSVKIHMLVISTNNSNNNNNNNNLRLLESRHTAQPTQIHNQQAAMQDSTSTSTGTQARYNNNRV